MNEHRTNDLLRIVPHAAPAPRVFLALRPPPSVQAALAAHTEAWQWNADAHRYAPADWHLTLHFLGTVPQDRLDALRAPLAVPPASCVLRFGQPTQWPHGLAVLLPQSVPPALMQLHARLAAAVQALGLATDTRAYRPHVTLARHAATAVPPVQMPNFDWPVQGYALMASTQTPHEPGAPRYRVLQSYGDAGPHEA